MKARITMTGKPYRSSLIPYEDEIIHLRRRRPPVPYAQIAELLRQKHNLIIHRSAIFKFVKVRSGGRKVYSYSRNAPEKKAATAPAPQVTASGPRPPAVVAVTVKRSPSTIMFEFTLGDPNNPTHLSPEEAGAILTKLEEEDTDA